MLLYPFEEQFDLPSFAIQFGNRQSLQLEVIRQKPINDSGAKIFIDSESECVMILVGGYCNRQSYSLVRNQSCTWVNLSALQNLIYHIILCPGNKVCVVEMKVLVDRIKPHIALVHQIVSDGFHRNFVLNFRIKNSSMSKIDECRDRASEIHQCMHLERTFIVMESRPREEFKTQFNGAAVKGINHLIKIYSKLLAGILVLCFTYQDLSKILIDTPILLLIRFCKRGLGHCFESRSVEVLSAEVKCSLNVSQTGTVGELSKAHHHELITAIELNSMSVAFVAVNTLFELICIDKRHNLCENCFPFIHSLRNAA